MVLISSVNPPLDGLIAHLSTLSVLLTRFELPAVTMMFGIEPDRPVGYALYPYRAIATRNCYLRTDCGLLIGRPWLRPELWASFQSMT